MKNKRKVNKTVNYRNELNISRYKHFVQCEELIKTKQEIKNKQEFSRVSCFFLGEPKEGISHSYWKGNPCVKRYDSNQKQKHKGQLLKKMKIKPATYIEEKGQSCLCCCYQRQAKFDFKSFS